MKTLSLFTFGTLLLFSLTTNSFASSSPTKVEKNSTTVSCECAKSCQHGKDCQCSAEAKDCGCNKKEMKCTKCKK